MATPRFGSGQRTAQRGRAARHRARALHRRSRRAGPGCMRRSCARPVAHARSARVDGRGGAACPACSRSSPGARSRRRPRRDPARGAPSRARRQADVPGRDAGAGGRSRRATSASRSRSWSPKRRRRRRTPPKRCGRPRAARLPDRTSSARRRRRAADLGPRRRAMSRSTGRTATPRGRRGLRARRACRARALDDTRSRRAPWSRAPRSPLGCEAASATR